MPLTGADRLGHVSRLYRALTDPRTVRDCWDRLPEDERAMVRLLAVSEETALTLPELATHLGISEAEARQIAVRLYHKAIIAREGDDEPLPVGVLPRLFLPRELTSLFRRVQDEIEAGDVSGTPLRALLALLDDAEIEEAAETWGVRIIPGLRGRDELTNLILNHVRDAGHLNNVVRKLKRDAASIWQCVRAEPTAAPVPLAEAAAAAGLSPDDPRHAQRLRDALAELETALLVWHTYRPDGSRWLFIPEEIRAPRPAATDGPPAPEPLAEPPAELPAWRHPHALAWDLLTVLRALTAPDAPAVADLDELPRSWLRRLNRDLWNRGPDLPPTGYISFLVTLADAEGLIELEPGEPVALTSAIRAWRDRSFADQTARLLGWWLGLADWVEGRPREEIEVWGAEWAPFRRRLLAHLTGLADDAWYPIEAVATWLAARDPELLGSTLTVATARSPAETDEAARRRAAIAEVVSVTLETAVSWFGLIELTGTGRQPRAMRLTPAGHAVAMAEPLPVDQSPAGPPLRVLPTLEIEVLDPSPLRVWSLSAFADLARLGEVSTYRLSQESLIRALAAGFEVRHVLSFLTNQAGASLPAGVEQQVQAWAQGYRRVRLTRTIVATPDDPGAAQEIREAARAAGFAARVEGQSVMIEPSEPGATEAALEAALRERGLAPQWSALPGQIRPRGSSRR